MIRKSLAHNIRAVLWSNQSNVRSLQFMGIARFAAHLLIGIALVKTGFETSLLGYFEMIMFGVNISSFFWLHGGKNAILSWVPGADKDREDRFRNVFLAYQGFGVLAGVISLPVFFLLTGRLPAAPFPIALALFVFFYVASSCLEFILFLRGRYAFIVRFSASFYTAYLLVILLVLQLTSDFTLLLWSLALLHGLKWILTLVNLRKGGRTWFHRGLSRAFLLAALPLILHALLSGIVEYIDGWIVSAFFDDASFAIYRYGARELPLFTLIVAGIVSAYIPLVRQLDAGNIRRLRAESKKLAVWMLGLGGVLMLISPLLFPLVYSSEFALSARLFNIYLLILISRVMMPQVFLYSFQKGWLLTIATLGEAMLNVGLSLLLMGHFGLEGIAWATVIAFTIHKLFLLGYVQVREGIPAARYVEWKTLLVFSTFLLCSFMISQLYS